MDWSGVLTDSWVLAGGLLVSFYIYYIVVDLFFGPALLVLVHKWNVSHDVAGALLLALGGSSPELFTNGISLLVVKSNVGLGTVIGSLVFNTFVIVSVSILVSPGRTLVISHWPAVRRDLTFYGVTSLALVPAVFLKAVHVADAAVLVALYLVYVGVCARSHVDRVGSIRSFGSARHGEPLVAPQDGETAYTAIADEADGWEVDSIDSLVPPYHEGVLQPQSRWLWPLHAPLLPVIVCMRATIPLMSHRARRVPWAILACLMSCAWLLAAAWLMTSAADRLAENLDVPESTVGLTVGAIGTSLPNLFGSVFAARRGYGEMALANVLGSNVFCTTMALGLPWVVRIALDAGSPYPLAERGLELDVSAPLVSLLVLAVTLVATHLRPSVGAALVFATLYAVYIVLKLVDAVAPAHA